MQKLYYEHLECPNASLQNDCHQQTAKWQSISAQSLVNSKTRSTPQDTDTIDYKQKHIFTEFHVISFQHYQKHLLLDVTNFQQLFTIWETRIKPIKSRILSRCTKYVSFRLLQQKTLSCWCHVVNFKQICLRHGVFLDFIL